MLPSVSAGSAALTKYAQAVAIAASEDTYRDSDTTTRPEQEAARQNAEKQPVPAQAPDSLARDARATVEAVLELLRVRVLTALIGVGASEEVAHQAANAASAELATAFAGESRHAAEIVHALLEQLQIDRTTKPERLLQFVAQGLVVVIDHVSGEVRITAPRVEIAPGNKSLHAKEARHLLDFTDRSANSAAPVLQALSAVHSAASAVIERVATDNTARTAKPIAPSAFIVAPDAFVRPLTNQLQTVLPTGSGLTAEVAAQTISRALSQAIATAVNTGGVSTPSVGEIMTAARQFQVVPAAGRGDEVSPAPTGRIKLAAGPISVALDTSNGATTIQIGNRTSAFAPVSAAAQGASIQPLPGVTSTLPAPQVSSPLPVGTVLDEPVGVPFIPPAFDETPPVIAPVPAQPPGQAPTQVPGQPGTHQPGPAPANTPAATAASFATLSLDESLRHIDPAVLRNATIMRSVGPVAGSDVPALTRIAIDIAAEIAPGAPVAVNPPQIGKFGLPKPAPTNSENGPVLKHGYADATANQPPVLPAVHMRAQTQAEERKAPQKPRRKQLSAGRYANAAIDDAFTRDVPAEHQGLVFSSVVFSV